MDYISLNGFLHRNGLSDHSSCDGCFCLNGSSIIQFSLPDLLVPSSVAAVNFAVAEAMLLFHLQHYVWFSFDAHPSSRCVSTSAYFLLYSFSVIHNF